MRTRTMLCILACAATTVPAAAAPPLRPGKRVTVPGGPGAFDLMVVDAGTHRLFAAHKGTDTTAVYDLSKGTVVSLQTGAAQGIAIAPEDGKVFVGDEKEQMVVALDRTTLEKLAELKVDGPVDAVAFDPKNHMVYADHDDGTDVWVIDAPTVHLAGTVTIAGAPELIEYDAASDRLYQNIKPDNTVAIIDPATNAVVATWSTLPATSPHGLAIDEASHRLFTAGRNGKLVVIDMASGKPITNVDIAPGVDEISFDPGNRRIYCACAGAISVVQETPAGAESLGDVPAPKGAHTCAVDPRTHAVWISYADTRGSYLQQFNAVR